MSTSGSRQNQARLRRVLRVCLSTFVLLALLFGGMPVGSVHAASTWTVTKTADTEDGKCDRDCSLREAIQAASTGDTIQFARNQTITLRRQLPGIYQRITIKGKGTSNTIIQASTCNPVTLAGGCTPATYRVFAVTSSGSLTLEGVTVRHGNCNGSCDRALMYGGGIDNAGGRLTIKNSAIEYNRSDYGGGIFNDEKSRLTVTNSLISSNRAISGGGVENRATLALVNSTFDANNAKYGGGVYNLGRLTVTNTTLRANSAQEGGGIYNLAILKVTRSTFLNNQATNYGGSIFISYNSGEQLSIRNSTISGSTAAYGGGIYNGDSMLTVINTTFYANQAVGTDNFGGGIYNDGNATLRVMDSEFSSNRAYNGGGIQNFATLEVTNSTFSDNVADYLGGAISNSSSVTVSNSLFSTNSAGSYGGGIWNGSWMAIDGTQFYSNRAPYGPSLSNDGEQSLSNVVLDPE